ncbi:MAG: phosphoglycerate dehydrogenase [Chthoniobacterales bacterium]
MKLKVLVADPIAPRGIEELKNCEELDVLVQTGLSEDEIIKIAPELSAIVVRSQTKITAKIFDAAPNLKVVGRAGVGVDNVDVPSATSHGVIVMNTPGGNTISTAEHAFSLMMSLARNIPQADASVKANRWDRKKYQGVELYGKTLGILGMGRIGSEIASRALAFGMKVCAYDPYLSATKAKTLQVELVENLDDLLPKCDFLTLHMPLTAETKHMLDTRRLALCKKGVRIINCARGGLVEETALAEALASTQVAGAALDVFETEPPTAELPILQQERAVFTPHLGASTTEAQENVGIEIAEAIRAILLFGEVRNAVNVPSIDAKTLETLGPWIDFCQRLGAFLGQLSPKRVEKLRVRFSGKIGERDLTPLTRSVLTGFLRHIGGAEINQVNAPARAGDLGISIVESRHSEPGEFSEWIEASVESGNGTASVRGTFFGRTPRVVIINERFVEAKPEGVVLIIENTDAPGIVGQVGTALAEDKVNIASMSLSRNEIGGTALTVLNLDSRPSDDMLTRLVDTKSILSAKVIEI